MPFPAVQEDLVVDKNINPGIISIEQKTFKSVEEGLNFFHCDRLAVDVFVPKPRGVRRPPHPENEASECKVTWMWRSHFQGRKRSHELRNLQWRSSSWSSVEIRSLVLADLIPQEIAWWAELVNNLAAGTNKQRRWFSQRTFGGSSKRLSYDSKYSLVVRQTWYVCPVAEEIPATQNHKWNLENWQQRREPSDSFEARWNIAVK